MAGKKRRTSTTTTKTSDTNEMRSAKKARVDPMAVPELLYAVLSFATRSTLASCARVCKLWSEVALDSLWRHLDSVFPLLELVTSLELLRDINDNVSNALQIFADDLSKADWPRFRYYSNRVRSLSHSFDDPYRGHWAPSSIAPEAIGLLCLHHSSDLAIVPHLETLKWSTYGSTASILPFLSPRVKSLEVDIEGGSEPVNYFFRALRGRTLNLKTFTLATPTSIAEIEEPLQQAIRTWTNLETLKLPPYYLRPSIRGIVASLPNLIVLRQEFTYSHPYHESAVLHELPENAFPRLTSFDFNCSPASAHHLTRRHSELFTRLTSMHIGYSNGVNNEEVLELVRHLGKNCAQLTIISLNFPLGVEPEGGDVSPLPFKFLEHLFPCRQLRMLEINHPFPFTINEGQVERMAEAWPQLNDFSIANEPDSSLPIPEDMGNSLSILSAFARLFPMMKDLALFSAEHEIPRFSGDLYPDYEFYNLEHLNVGLSVVPGGRSQEVGFLIASLCRFEPTIQFGASTWYTATERLEWRGRRCQWEETSKQLGFAMRTKIAGRAKMAVQDKLTRLPYTSCTEF